MAASRIALVGVAAVSLGACVGVVQYPLYSGPRRPDSETMLVEANGTAIVSIDNVEPRRGSKFRILPGRHHLEVVLDAPGMRSSTLSMPVCFTGRPGHAYLVRPQHFEGIWRPEIIDETAAYRITSDDCAPRRTAALAPPAPPPATAPSPEPASPDGGTATDGATATASGELPPASAAPAPVLAGSPAPAADDETPAPKARPGTRGSTDDESPRALVVTPPAPPPPFKPTFDFGGEMGIVQGGEELATATTSNGDKETLGAGDGLLLAFTARLTPLWLSDRFGLGVGGSAGLKYWSVGSSGAEASMFRWLVTGSAHALIPVDETWLVFLSGGLERDSGIDFAINGTSYGIPFRSRTGFVADFGAQRALDENWSYAFSLRVTILDYAVQGVSIGANSVGLTISLHCGS